MTTTKLIVLVLIGYVVGGGLFIALMRWLYQ